MNKTALITGGSRGIGLGIAKKLASEGYDLAINGVRPENDAKEVLEELRTFGNKVIYCQGDIGSSQDREKIVLSVKSVFGQLNLLVNNAGVAPKERLDLLEVSEESLDRLLGINLKGAFFLTQSISKWMIEERKKDKDYAACVINITSVSVTEASVQRGEYCISKAGLGMMSRLFAIKLGEFDIPVYEIRPGVIFTDMVSVVKDKYDKMISEGLCLQSRWGMPEDIGRAVASLARGDFAYATGQTFIIDGGLTVPRF